MTEKITGRLEAVVGLLLDAVSGIEASQATELVAEATRGSHALAALDWHLRDHPDALSSGAPTRRRRCCTSSDCWPTPATRMSLSRAASTAG
ncbi:MAG: hypothetical protein ACYCV5_04980 [Acidimicrobiales bacterium]